MKKLFVTVIALSTFMSVYAGGLLTNTNQSVHFLRNPARDASMEIDAVYTNPAGLAKLPVNGWHFSFSNQSAFQKRTITSTFGTTELAPFAGNGGNPTKEFVGKATSPIIPSLFGVYKMDKWAFSLNLGVIGGGGKAKFDDGLPSFEAPISMIPLQLGANGIPTTKYSADIYLEGSSIIYDGQLGATYAINDMFSVYAGGRVNFMNNGYVGHIRNISINPAHPLNPDQGEMMLATKFFTNAQEAAQGAANLLQPIIDGGAAEYTLNQLLGAGYINSDQFNLLAGGLGLTPEQAGDLQVGYVQGAYNLAAATYGENAQLTADKELDCTQTGIGITPILGFNFNWKKLNVGIKYEFITKIDVKNKTDVNTTGMEAYDDGVKTPNDIPALLTVGAQYAVIPSVKISAGYHHFFDSNAKMANDKQKHIDGGINEFLLGAEWQINKMFLVSAGGQVTRTGVTDDYQSDMSHSFNSYSVGLGGAINVSKSVRINLAYFFTKYEDWTKEFESYYGQKQLNGQGIWGKDVYSRTNNVFGIGVDFRF